MKIFLTVVLLTFSRKMGQTTSRLRKKASNLSTRSEQPNMEADGTEGKKIEKGLAVCFCDYNRALLEELKESSLQSSSENLQDLRLIRLALEDTINDLEIKLGSKVRNTFTSFSPWKYSLTLPVVESSGEAKKRRSNSITSIRRHDLRFDSDSPIFTSIFIEAVHTSHHSIFKLLFATATDICSKVEIASQFGRIVGFNLIELQSIYIDPIRLPVLLLIKHICGIFSGNVVSGIPFIHVDLNPLARGDVSTPFKTLNNWLNWSLSLSLSDMIREFDRLNRIAFKVSRTSTLVFLLTNADPCSARMLVDLLREFLKSNKPPLAIISGRNLDEISDPLISGVDIYTNQVTIEKNIDTTQT